MLGPCRAAASLFVCTSQRLLLLLLLLLVLLSLRVSLHQQQSGCWQRRKHGCESRQEPTGPAHRLPGRHRRDLGHRLVSPPLRSAPLHLPPLPVFLRSPLGLVPADAGTSSSPPSPLRTPKSGSGSAHGGAYLRGRMREAAGWGSERGSGGCGGRLTQTGAFRRLNRTAESVRHWTRAVIVDRFVSGSFAATWNQFQGFM